MSINLVFHVASALAFLLLIIYLLKLQAQVQFSRLMWRSLDPQRSKVYVDWPENFLAKLGEAWDVNLEGESPKTKPCKIHLETWLRAGAQLTIVAMRWSAGNQMILIVRKLPPPGQWEADLEKALSQTIKVSLVVEGKRS